MEINEKAESAEKLKRNSSGRRKPLNFMKKAKVAEKPKKTLPEVTQRIQELAQQHDWFKVRDDLRKRTTVGSANWTNYWNGTKNKKWTLPVLSQIAAVLGTTVDVLLGKRPPIPIVAEVSALEDFPYKEEWLPEDKIGQATNFMWEGEDTLKQIYALKVKDLSMLPLSKGTVLYAQKNSPPEDFQNFDLVVYCNAHGRAQVRQIILKPEQIVLRSLNSTIEEELLPRKHLSSCDLIVLTSRCKF